MTKNLLKLLATVTVAGLLVGCGSSSSDDNTTIPPVVDNNNTPPVVEDTYLSNITLANGKLTTNGKELTLNSLKIMDGNSTHIEDTDDNKTYSISSLYYLDGIISTINEDNKSMLTAIDTNVTAAKIPEPTLAGDITAKTILPFYNN